MVAGVWGGITHPLPKLKAAPLASHAHSDVHLAEKWVVGLDVTVSEWHMHLGYNPTAVRHLSMQWEKHLLGL